MVSERPLQDLKCGAAPAAWADTYSGNGGVVRSGSQFESASVARLPSRAASRMAVYGRQWLYSYLESQVGDVAVEHAHVEQREHAGCSPEVRPPLCDELPRKTVH